MLQGAAGRVGGGGVSEERHLNRALREERGAWTHLCRRSHR